LKLLVFSLKFGLISTKNVNGIIILLFTFASLGHLRPSTHAHCQHLIAFKDEKLHKNITKQKGIMANIDRQRYWWFMADADAMKIIHSK